MWRLCNISVSFFILLILVSISVCGQSSAETKTELSIESPRRAFYRGEEILLVAEIANRGEKPVLDAVCTLAPPIVHFADNLSSDNMAGLYDEYMASGHRKRIERFHEVGTKCAVHLDGVVRGLLPKLASVGFDAIEALTPQPGGDLPVEKMREIAQNDSVVFWGGVPGILFAPPYTWEDMEKHVYEVLEAWSGTRFILGVADQIPPDGDIQFCPKISDLVEN